MAKKATRSTTERAAAKKTVPRKGAASKKRKVTTKKTFSRSVQSRKTKPPELKYDESILGPKHWTKDQLAQFKEMILAKRRETLEELDTLKESMMDVTTGEYVSESSNYSLHMEQGTDAMEREKTFLLASRGSKFVNQLDDALARIEGGKYGVCRMCELLIPKERLEAVPTAQTCAEYKNTNMPCERGKVALELKKQKK
ncbi:MAG: TraR/DksA C4-type zinc finger protein [Bacteroidota bacterium]